MQNLNRCFSTCQMFSLPWICEALIAIKNTDYRLHTLYKLCIIKMAFSAAVKQPNFSV